MRTTPAYHVEACSVCSRRPPSGAARAAPPRKLSRPTAPFPEGVLWGSATAAAQVERAASDDGRGPSIWDMLCRKAGKVYRDQCPDRSADHYHRLPEDLAIMRELGLDAYRFGVSWSRALPEGVGAVNERGLDLYDRLLDGIAQAGIAPWLTLYHWDLRLSPCTNAEAFSITVIGCFGDYAAVIAKRLGDDRVAAWIPLNSTSRKCSSARVCRFGRLPLYITEHGVAVSDWVSPDGKCHDPLRIDFTAPA